MSARLCTLREPSLISRPFGLGRRLCKHQPSAQEAVEVLGLSVSDVALSTENKQTTLCRS